MGKAKPYKDRHYYHKDYEYAPIYKKIMARIVDVSDYAIEFKDEKGERWGLVSEHDQDCCESHFLDMRMILDCNVGTATGLPINVREQKFELSKKGIKFKKVDGEGIILYDAQGNRYFIAGRGYNNGYYGTNISLCLYHGNMLIQKWDVSECQEINA